MKATKAVACFRCTYVIQPGQEIVQRAYGTYHEKCYRELCSAGPRIPGVGATAILLLLLCLPAFADRPNPQMTCKGIHGSQVRCEAKYVWPEIPVWKAGEMEYGPGYGEGFGMTMKLTEAWTIIRMEAGGQVLEAEARVVEGKVHFRRAQLQTASKPP